MKKAELNRIVEKASSQTKGEAMRVVDMLFGSTPDQLTKETPAKRKGPKHLPAESATIAGDTTIKP